MTLRYFAGLSVEETAKALDFSPATIKNEWAFARAWLYRQLGPPGVPPPAGARELPALVLAEEIFLALADLSAERSRAVVRDRCGEDSAAPRGSRGAARDASRARRRVSRSHDDSALDMNAVDGPLQPGTPLGQFLVLHAIGSGGMGVVYAAQQDRPRRTVAIKVLRRDSVIPKSSSGSNGRPRCWASAAPGHRAGVCVPSGRSAGAGASCDGVHLRPAHHGVSPGPWVDVADASS